MFNKDAEIFVIFYGFAAGGKFLQLAMHLDPDMASLNGEPKPSYGQVLEYLNNDRRSAHMIHSDMYTESIEKLTWANRYVFHAHLDIMPMDSVTELMRQCKNVKTIFLTVSTDQDCILLNKRRWALSGTPVCDSERLLSTWIPKLSDPWWGAKTVLNLNIQTYWTPELAKEIISKFFNEQSINSPGWDELYNVWHKNCIERHIDV